jgi:hypothetical protein
MKKQKRKLGLQVETIRVLDGWQAIARGAINTGMTCYQGQCSLSNSEPTVDPHQITCSCNTCQRL